MSAMKRTAVVALVIGAVLVVLGIFLRRGGAPGTGGSELALAASVAATQGGRCAPSHRRSAIAAFFVAAVLLVLSLFLAGRPGTGGGFGGGDGTGIGPGTGSGLGAGNGTGTGKKGDGPGAGSSGSGRGADGPDAPIPPKGRPDGTAIAEADPPAERTKSEAEVDAPASVPVEVPEFGFTRPSTSPAPPPPPPPADPVGLPDGGPSGGTEGIVGGGGGTEQRITKLVENFANSRVTINLDATGSMESQRDAVARVIPEIFDKVQSGTIAVKVFRDIEQGERNEEVIKPTARTRNKSEIAKMVARVLAVEAHGGGDLPETGYQLVIENMKKDKHGTERHPNVQFIVTDAPEKQPELLQQMLGLMRKTNTRVFVYDTSVGTCIEIK
jgi:hypothetical protein